MSVQRAASSRKGEDGDDCLHGSDGGALSVSLRLAQSSNAVCLDLRQDKFGSS